MRSLGKCDVKGCEREAARASVALLPDGGAVPVVVCVEHHEEGTKRYRELYGKNITITKVVRKHAS